MNSLTEKLPILMCNYIEFSNGVDKGKDCSFKSPALCIECPVKSSFFRGEEDSINNFSSIGHLTCLLLWSFIIIVGVLGLLGNIVVIKVFKRRDRRRTFELLLIVQASVDIFCCAMTVLVATTYMSNLENWDGRGAISMYLFYFTSNMMVFGRSLSVFITVLISITSFIKIFFPVRTQFWFTHVKTMLLCLSVLILALILSIPGFTSVYIDINPYLSEISSLKEFPHIIRVMPTLNNFWNGTLSSAHEIVDVWLPILLLFIFGVFSFWKARKLNGSFSEVSSSERRQARNVSMFLPVIIVFFICNVGPMANYLLVHLSNIQYREMNMILCLSIALNSSLKFPAYCIRGENFRRDSQITLFICFATIEKPNRDQGSNIRRVGTGVTETRF
ncbi:unnamed protein product [Orchesella dallaii]|uniref:G-protein coupled receptors family 1 profile domain-containing protein n=1 Tax=Orchesella dallaii TaxID=48710 RepID=A0ABP1Q389_9HEXA